jgi:hypothetical protein
MTDPEYGRPVIDRDEQVSTPTPHRKISGHFEGPGTRFTIHLPPKGRWKGRFFQRVYPLQDEHIEDRTVAFTFDSGAYTVQTNGGAGYRAEAAAAVFARTVAADHYSWRGRIHGYIYGSSGGSFQTIGAAENTSGVWDGAVPVVSGAPTAIPNTYTVRALARFVLRDKAAGIADAVRPGGSGDPYARLDAVERAVLREVTRMGVPLRAWEDHPYLLGLSDPQGLLGLGSTVRTMDPSYADHFWSKPGYLGTDTSPLGRRFRAALTDHRAAVTRVERDSAGRPTSLALDRVPGTADPVGMDFTAYAPDGTTRIGTVLGSLDRAAKAFTLGAGNSADVLDALASGCVLRADNRWFLALHTYHRHQVPMRPGYYTWDQYRGPDGQPIPPQRGVEVGPVVSQSISDGGTHSGKINGKMIVVGNLLDADAFPWHCDWYATRVREVLGGQAYEENFRLWFNDHADHLVEIDHGRRAARLVDYGGIVQQALRDVSAWAERGTAPPSSTRYTVTNGQIAVPAKVAGRHGVQPVVHLTAGGEERIEVRAGRPVTFTATIRTPPRTGRIVETAWDFTGAGEFTARPAGPARQTVRVRATHVYTEPGTYYAALRATAQRDGDRSAPFARVHTLGRVRVVVRPEPKLREKTAG